MKIRKKEKYVEMPLTVFVEEFPELARLFPINLNDYVSDTEYRVRLSDNGRIEFGYLSDDWSIK